MSRSACEVCGETYDYCGQCGTCHKCMGEDIYRLKAELEDAKDEAFKREARIMMYVNKNSDIKRQLDASQALLAEAKAEVDRLSALTGEWCKTAEMYRRFETEARKQTAREIVEMLRGAPNGFYIANMIKRRFGLEG